MRLKKLLYRRYIQFQYWLGNEINAPDGGWKSHSKRTISKFTYNELTPENVCCTCEKKVVIKGLKKTRSKQQG